MALCVPGRRRWVISELTAPEGRGSEGGMEYRNITVQLPREQGWYIMPDYGGLSIFLASEPLDPRRNDSSRMLEGAPVPIGDCSLTAHVPTNISIAVSAHMIGMALPAFLESEFAVDTSRFPTLEGWQRTHEADEKLGWDTLLA
jgi:hypothetical protein